MQSLQSSFATLWTNIQTNHNDRKNDAILYYLSFSLYIMILFGAIYTAPSIIQAGPILMLVGILSFFLAITLSTHWYQSLSVRYWSASFTNPPFEHEPVSVENI